MKHIAPITLAALVALAGCSRDEPAPEAPTAPAPAASGPAPAAPTPAPVSPAAAPAAEDPATPFDKAAFGGTFSGGGLRLELRGDGTYALEGADGAHEGSWTHEPDTQVIRLDPGSKTAQDRVFRLEGRDALVTLDAAGQPTTEGTLRRQPAR